MEMGDLSARHHEVAADLLDGYRGRQIVVRPRPVRMSDLESTNVGEGADIDDSGS